MSESALCRTFDIFAPTVSALGGPTFADELISAIDRLLPVDHLCLMRFDSRSGPAVLESATLRGGEHVPEVQRAYLGGYYRHDPSLRVLESGRFRDGIAIERLHRDSMGREAYGRHCYARVRLLERLTIAFHGDGRLHCLNLYRHDEAGDFVPEEVETVEALARFLAAIAGRHGSAAHGWRNPRDRFDRMAAFDARLRAVDDRLTRRERDVLARILVGMTSEGIALDLGIGLNSVLTYRKRAYGRLTITSQAELFSICLG